MSGGRRRPGNGRKSSEAWIGALPRCRAHLGREEAGSARPREVHRDDAAILRDGGRGRHEDVGRGRRERRGTRSSCTTRSTCWGSCQWGGACHEASPKSPFAWAASALDL